MDLPPEWVRVAALPAEGVLGVVLTEEVLGAALSEEVIVLPVLLVLCLVLPLTCLVLPGAAWW